MQQHMKDRDAPVLLSPTLVYVQTPRATLTDNADYHGEIVENREHHCTLAILNEQH